MQITNVRCVQLVRRLDRVQRNSCSARRERWFTLVLVETDAGLTGLGDAFGDPLLMPTIIERRLAPMVVGLDPLDVAAVWKRLFASREFWEVGGSALCGISAIEVACWDLRGQAEGVPVCELLGGRKRDWVEPYASDLHWDEPQVMADLAAGYVRAGFRYVKTHLGAPGERDGDLARCEAIRRAIGPDVAYMIDVNTAFDRETALARGREFRQFDPFWYEEPLSPLDWQGHAWLREQLRVPIATGENLYTTHGFEPLLNGHGCDYVMPDILRCGGLEQTRRICLAAEQHGIVASPHNFSSGVGLAATLHLMAALPATRLLEFDPTGTAVYEELFAEPLAVERGSVRVPTGPGLGVRLTEALVGRYAARS
jgi:L-alanine-DL-glutamate epimerase-like enolase superfamily enzyme